MVLILCLVKVTGLSKKYGETVEREGDGVETFDGGTKDIHI